MPRRSPSRHVSGWDPEQVMQADPRTATLQLMAEFHALEPAYRRLVLRLIAALLKTQRRRR